MQTVQTNLLSRIPNLLDKLRFWAVTSLPSYGSNCVRLNVVLAGYALEGNNPNRFCPSFQIC
jgi:hypothetical protein